MPIPSAQGARFLYQINVTRACNLRCSHCYIDNSVKERSGSLSVEHVVEIAGRIAEHLEAAGRSEADIHIVGGEPTMLGLSWFADAVPRIRRELAGFPGVRLRLITNLVRRDAVDIAALFDSTATSFEPETRFRSKAGRPLPHLQSLWERNLHAAIARGLEVSVSSAITKASVAHGAASILDYLYDLGVSRVHFGFMVPEGDGLANAAAVIPSFLDTAHFLIDSARWAVAHRECTPAPVVGPFEEVLAALASQEPPSGVYCPINSGSIDIHWDGSVAACVERGGSRTPSWSGNVFALPIAAITRGEAYSREVVRAARGPVRCLACPERSVCRGGCGVLAMYPDQSGECHGFRSFLLHVRESLNSGVRPRQC